jgi:electron transfer flavoprotein alpha subunit
MSRTLLIAEHDGKNLNPSTAKALTGALAVGHPVDIAVFAADAGAVAEQVAGLEGAETVIKVEREENEHLLAATLAPQIQALAEGYSHVFMPSTTFGKDVMPRAAALLGSPQVSDIMEVLDAHSFKRPIYANNVIVTVKAPEEAVVTGTIRTASFKDAKSGGSAEITSKDLSVELPTHTRFKDIEVHKSDRPDLQSAQRVVSGGRGVGSEENFEIIYRIADKLGAGVGASRAAVDAGFVPNDMQVGQTGKIVAPELYMCFGISGAIQHVTGIKDAGTIVAINKDPDAPIFDIADIGLVGDLFDIIPELEKALD